MNFINQEVLRSQELVAATRKLIIELEELGFVNQKLRLTNRELRAKNRELIMGRQGRYLQLFRDLP